MFNAVTNLSYSGPPASLHSTSHYGPLTDFTAPGTQIFTTDRTGLLGDCPAAPAHVSCQTPSNNFVLVTGTSFATPAVAGASAVVLATNLDLDPPEVEWVLQRSADTLGASVPDARFGWGLPRLDAAVAFAADLIFFDGFEDGSTYWWSEVVN